MSKTNFVNLKYALFRSIFIFVLRTLHRCGQSNEQLRKNGKSFGESTWIAETCAQCNLYNSKVNFVSLVFVTC